MNDLRTALIVLGAVFLVVLLLWERRRASRRARAMPLPEQTTPAATTMRPRRLEPSIEDFTPRDDEDAEALEVPTIHPVDPVRVEVMKGAAVDIPSAAQPPAIRWPPPQTERVLSLRLVKANGEALNGRALRQALEAAGMVHGPQRIYHLVDAQGAVRASAANLVRPGSLDPAQMDAQEFRGVSVFSILPGPVAAVQMFDALVQLARAVASRTGAVVQDEHGALLEGQRLAQLRSSLQGRGPATGDSTP
jgi:FtsZ-interacting cell division protein ZipA